MRSLKAVLVLSLTLALAACSSSSSSSEDYTFDVNGVEGRLNFTEVSAESTQVTVSFADGRFSNEAVSIRRSGESDLALNNLDGDGSSVTTVNVSFDDVATSGALVVGDPADPDFAFDYLEDPPTP